MPTTSKPLVLYADDDPDDVLLIHHAFRDNGVDVELVTVHDGLQAINFLQQLKENDRLPCLVLLDINMPRLNGRETLVSLRKMERFATVPVILFTTSSMELHRSFARQYDAGFMTKPLRDYQLEAIIQQFIRINVASANQ